MEIYLAVMRYLKRTGMPQTVFGRRAVNDPRLVGDMRNGRELRVETRARVIAYIAAHPGAYQRPPSTRGRYSNARSPLMRPGRD